MGNRELTVSAGVEHPSMSDFAQPSELSPPAVRAAVMKLPAQVRVRAPGHRAAIKSVKGALGFIERRLPAELARLPRWTFARALFLEAQRTGKSRDLNAAVRQFRQALSNERWLEEEEGEDVKPGKG
jgi:hypothetical protein